MAFVGGSTAVSGALVGAPLAAAQSLRYALAVLLLLGAARWVGVRVRRPRGTEWAWLVAVTLSGLLLFNIALVRGAEHAEPAVPVLAAHGAWGVSVHTTWMAAVGFGVAALPGLGAVAGPALSARELAAVAYLAVAVTAVAFVLWFSAVRGLGFARAGLLTGVAPVAAAVAGVLLGGPVPAAGVWAGTAVVATGLLLGLRAAGPQER